MGRRPNPLILEYFNRGAKLEDASNRYQHTCKSCGENFPKGRIDSLVAHLTKKCTSISLSERTKIVLRLHDLTDETSPKSTTGTRLEQGKNVSLPYSPSRQANFNGLNVLAEASRQVGATDQSQGAVSNATLLEGQNVPIDPALEVDAFANSFLNTVDDTFGVKPNGSSVPNTVAPLPSIFSYHQHQLSGSHDDPSHLPGLGLSIEPHASTLPSHLSSIAASANETLANVMLPISPDNDISTTLFNSLHNLNGLSSAQSANQQRESMNWANFTQGQPNEQQSLSSAHPTQDSASQTANQRAANFPRPIAINPNTRPTHFVSESGTSSKPQKPKVRGRFTADRRKEVQQVRKQGACIRCRMLKKPCSGDTPCSTCQSVESARLWKQPCVRTRIIEEFTLFSAGLHSTLVFHDLNNIKAQVKFDNFSGRFEASHFDEPSLMITISGLKGQSRSGPADAGLGFLSGSNLSSQTSEFFILDNEGDDASLKMEQYLRGMASIFHGREKSQLMRVTLLLASELSKKKDDPLLHKILELWTATHLLTDLDLTWKIVANPNQSPGSAADALLQAPRFTERFVDGRFPINEITNNYSYALLCSQLRATVERRANSLSKSIMNELERRLLQRQQSGHFETFLVALILLNCVERFCWLFLTWSDESRLSRWPLDKRPAAYAEQGERFADMLNMLLKMRGLPPKTSPRPDNGVLMPTDDEEGHASQWFADIKISPSFLEQVSSAQFILDDSRSLDGKYFARVLQPTACYT